MRQRSRRMYRWGVAVLTALLALTIGIATLGVSPAAAAPITVVDDGGPDDFTGQKDLTQLTIDLAPPTAGTVEVSWNWDNTSTNGANTLDGCSLYDTTGDGLADYALCVIGGGNPAEYDATALYSCNSSQADRCGGRVLIDQDANGDGALDSGTFASTCDAAVVAGVDPFQPGQDDFVADCTVVLSDFGAASATLLNVCSYPSQQPNSDPSDCVFVPNSGFLTIVKATTSPSTETFQFTSSVASAGGETTWSTTGAGTATQLESFESGTIDLTETAPATWALDGAVCEIQTATPQATGTPGADGVTGVEIRPGLETVCTFTNSLAVVAPTVQVVKGGADGNDTVATIAEPGGSVTFDVAVTNTAPAGIGDATLTTLTDAPYGDITTTGHDGITATDCATGQTIVGGATYTCSFTVDVEGQPGDLTDTVSATLTNVVGSDTDADQATVTITDVAPVPLTIEKSVTSAASLPEPGGDFDFQVVIANGSTVDTATVTAIDDTYLADLPTNGSCDATLPAELAPAGTLTCTFTVSHTGDPATFDNVVTVVATDDDGADVGGDSNQVTVEITDVTADITVVKTADPTTVPESGAPVTFSFVVTNDSAFDSVELTSLTDTVYGSLDGRNDCSVPQTLAPLASYDCSFTVDVFGQPGTPHENVVTAAGTDDDGQPVSDTDDATIGFQDVPASIDVTKTASPTTVPEPGDDVTYTFTVTNTSLYDEVTIDTLGDSIHGDLGGQGDCVVGTVLAPAGETGDSYSCSITVEVTGEPGDEIVNELTVGATDDDGQPLSGQDTATVTVVDVPSSISVTKTADPTTVPETGGDVSYTVVVTNTSAVDAVTITTVDDDRFGDIGSSCAPALPATLAPGQAITCTVTETISGPAGDDHVNVVTASGTDDDDDPVTGTARATVGFSDVLPDVSITKTASPTSVAEPGDDVEFTIVVTNDGLEAATIDSLTDSDFDLSTRCAAAVGTVLAPSGTYTCTFTETIAGDVGDDHANTATVEASDDDGNTDTAADDAAVTIGDTPPVLTVVKSGPATVAEGGDTATYSVTITNESASTDPVTVTSLTDDRFGNLLPEAETANGGSPIVIAPGGSFSFEFDRDLTLDVGETHVNEVTVVGVDDEGTTASDADDHTVGATGLDPAIDVVKTAEPTQVEAPGETVTFTVEIVNESASTDPVTVTSLTDDIHAGAVCLDGDGVDAIGQTIQPGATLTCSFTAFVAADETDTVTVGVVDDEGTPASDADSATVVLVTPSLSVTKTADVDWVDGAGDGIVFTISVENDGETTEFPEVDDVLSGGAIADPGSTRPVTGPFTDATLTTPVAAPGDGLAPGATWFYRAAYTVTGDDVDARTSLTNRACVPDVDGDGVDECGTVVVEIRVAELTIDKRTNGQDGPQLTAGSDIEWTYRVVNTGNVPVTGIVVTDSDPDVDVTCPATELDPGAEMTCTASGTAVQGPYTNTGTVTGVGPDGGPDPAEASDDSGYNGVYLAFTPGFWKNHDKGRNNLWDGDLSCANGVTIGLDTPLSAFFVIPDDYTVRVGKGKGRRSSIERVPINTLSLNQALSFQGGSGLDGAAEILLRAASASALNTCYHDTLGNDDRGVDEVWPVTLAELVAEVNSALASGERGTLLTLAGLLDGWNNGAHDIDWADWR